MVFQMVAATIEKERKEGGEEEEERKKARMKKRKKKNKTSWRGGGGDNRIIITIIKNSSSSLNLQGLGTSRSSHASGRARDKEGQRVQSEPPFSFKTFSSSQK
jgi:hypothetical protein